MLNKLYATKGEMTATYLGEVRTPVTKINVPTHVITQVKTEDKDGYKAVQVAFGKIRKTTSKALKGHLKKLKEAPRHIKELPPTEEEIKVGDELKVDSLLKVGDVVKVQGTTKGKGFTGVIKRWGFARQPKTHGQSDRVRAPGSIGQTTGVARVFPGKKMAGRHGSLTHTVKNSLITKIDTETGEVWLTGSVPGNRGALLTLTITDHKEMPELTPKTQEKSDNQETKQENKEFKEADK